MQPTRPLAHCGEMIELAFFHEQDSPFFCASEAAGLDRPAE
jgi:hypothetical protein